MVGIHDKVEPLAYFDKPYNLGRSKMRKTDNHDPADTDTTEPTEELGKRDLNGSPESKGHTFSLKGLYTGVRNAAANAAKTLKNSDMAATVSFLAGNAATATAEVVQNSNQALNTVAQTTVQWVKTKVSPKERQYPALVYKDFIKKIEMDERIPVKMAILATKELRELLPSSEYAIYEEAEKAILSKRTPHATINDKELKQPPQKTKRGKSVVTDIAEPVVPEHLTNKRPVYEIKDKKFVITAYKERVLPQEELPLSQGDIHRKSGPSLQSESSLDIQINNRVNSESQSPLDSDESVVKSAASDNVNGSKESDSSSTIPPEAESILQTVREKVEARLVGDLDELLSNFGANLSKLCQQGALIDNISIEYPPGNLMETLTAIEDTKVLAEVQEDFELTLRTLLRRIASTLKSPVLTPADLMLLIENLKEVIIANTQAPAADYLELRKATPLDGKEAAFSQESCVMLSFKINEGVLQGIESLKQHIVAAIDFQKDYLSHLQKTLVQAGDVLVTQFTDIQSAANKNIDKLTSILKIAEKELQLFELRVKEAQENLDSCLKDRGDSFPNLTEQCQAKQTTMEEKAEEVRGQFNQLIQEIKDEIVDQEKKRSDPVEYATALLKEEQNQTQLEANLWKLSSNKIKQVTNGELVEMIQAHKWLESYQAAMVACEVETLTSKLSELKINKRGAYVDARALVLTLRFSDNLKYAVKESRTQKVQDLAEEKRRQEAQHLLEQQQEREHLKIEIALYKDLVAKAVEKYKNYFPIPEQPRRNLSFIHRHGARGVRRAEALLTKMQEIATAAISSEDNTSEDHTSEDNTRLEGDKKKCRDALQQFINLQEGNDHSDSFRTYLLREIINSAPGRVMLCSPQQIELITGVMAGDKNPTYTRDQKGNIYIEKIGDRQAFWLEMGLNLSPSCRKVEMAQSTTAPVSTSALPEPKKTWRLF